MNTLQQGRVAEAYAIQYFVECGFDVYTPIFGNANCDFIVQKADETAKRVEIKSTSKLLPSGNYEIQLRSVRANKTTNAVKKFDSSRCDYLVVVVFADGKPFALEVLDAKTFNGRSTATITPGGKIK